MAYRVDLPPKWIDGSKLEIALRKDSGPLLSPESSVIFSIPSGAALIVDASVRLLSLSNQLNHVGKRVTLRFCREDTSAYDYLNRIGFFDELHPNIEVWPDRPGFSAAIRYYGTNRGVVEICRLRLGEDDHDIPDRLELDTLAYEVDGYSVSADKNWRIMRDLLDGRDRDFVYSQLEEELEALRAGKPLQDARARY